MQPRRSLLDRLARPPGPGPGRARPLLRNLPPRWVGHDLQGREPGESGARIQRNVRKPGTGRGPDPDRDFQLALGAERCLLRIGRPEPAGILGDDPAPPRAIGGANRGNASIGGRKRNALRLLHPSGRHDARRTGLPGRNRSDAHLFRTEEQRDLGGLLPALRRGVVDKPHGYPGHLRHLSRGGTGPVRGRTYCG